MGTQKTETSQSQSTKTELGERSDQEQRMLDMLESVAGGAAGQFDPAEIGKLLSGQGLMPTAGDKALVEESFGATRDMATRALEDFIRQGNLGLDESLSARGIQGSSIEAVQRATVNRDANRQMANILDQSRGQGAQALMGLPFQRAGMQLNANQQLFQQLLGAGGNVANFGLQERLADIDTFGTGSGTQTVQPGIGQYLQLGMQLPGAFPGSPAK
jgi:hypothetical protein